MNMLVRKKAQTAAQEPPVESALHIINGGKAQC